SILFLSVAAAIAAGCSSSEGRDPSGNDTSLAIDRTEIVRGVADRGRDPAVVAIDIAGEGLCTGSLVGTNVVLTARHCVSKTVEEVACPSTAAQISGDYPARDLTVYSGEDTSHIALVGHGKTIVVPDSDVLCDQDVAFIVLDREVTHIAPLALRASPVTVGDRVRAVGFGKKGDNGSAGTKLLRDNVRVLQTSSAEFLVGEATCQGDSGGPALDARTGEVMGVVSRGGPTCDGKNVHNIYSRVDAHRDLVEDASRHGAHFATSKGDGGASSPNQPATDMGQPCQTAADCSTGLCVQNGTNSYCSRECGNGNRCPTHYHCGAARDGTPACAQVSP
ncbi:MAG TPA: S1 family peptidase, partial [Polyangiaceae bacterium]|nr:S1 family peptidase [Polyangiaceae bacterium]